MEEALRDNLFRLSMQKKWDEIAIVYKTISRAASVILTKSRETALHVAISSYRGKAADHIKIMFECTPEEILRMQNNQGNTPLHIAAAVGWEEMCKLISDREPLAIYVRNLQKQTPLFMAAHHGNLEAFRCLHQMNVKRDRQEDPVSLCRGGDGNTILHSAISAENFELAFEIIRYYPQLAKSMNEKGETPIDVLASKSSVFDSSTPCYSFFYRYLFVEKLKQPELEDGGHGEEEEKGKPILKSDEENQLQNKSGFSARHRKARFLQLAYKAILTVLGVGISEIREIQIKQQHIQAIQIMNKLIELESQYRYYGHSDEGEPPYHGYHESCHSFDMKHILASPPDAAEGTNSGTLKRNTALLKAAERGNLVLVEKILTSFPVAINEVDHHGKNVLMVASENRHGKVFDYLLTLDPPLHMFHQVDHQGNNVLHLAAYKGQLDSWRMLSATRLMQWEYNWYQHVKDSVPALCALQENLQGKTPWQIFSATHEDLERESAQWYMRTSESYSVVAALVATVAYATYNTVPGGLNQTTGYPIMLARREFDIFSTSSLSALCLSVTALLFFLAIMSSPECHFKSSMPRKLLIGLTCLFGSIVAMLVSFFAGHSFVLGEKLGRVALPFYATTCAAVTIFAIANLPLFFAVKVNLRSLPS